MIAQRIRDACAQMQILLPEGAAERMQAYWERVLETNRTLNLTRIVEEEQACWLHFVDSLAPLLYGEELLPKGAKVLDVGTGAGFPGVPLLLARPDLDMTLIDARQKRVRFVQEGLEALNADARVMHRRAEDMGEEKFDVVLCRAVASVKDIVRIALPLVRRQGMLLLWKGPSVFVEMEQAKASIDEMNGQIFVPNAYELPGIGREHCLLALGWK